jgi:hypothetical protein
MQVDIRAIEIRLQKQMPHSHSPQQTFADISKPQTTPPLSLGLGFGAMSPIAASAALALSRSAGLARLGRVASVIWSASVLLFLAGVRRGLSFRQPGGPTTGQIASTLWYFVAGAGALTAAVLNDFRGALRIPLLFLLGGFSTLAVFDRQAAKKLEAPPFFSRLRPVQMLIPIAALSLVLLLQRRDSSD